MLEFCNQSWFCLRWRATARYTFGTMNAQMEIEARLEGLVASVDPIALREEMQRLGKLIQHARALEGREIESKLVKLRKVLSDNNVFNDPCPWLAIDA